MGNEASRAAAAVDGLSPQVGVATSARAGSSFKLPTTPVSTPTARRAMSFSAFQAPPTPGANGTAKNHNNGSAATPRAAAAAAASASLHKQQSGPPNVERTIQRMDKAIRKRVRGGITYNMKIVLRGARGTGKTSLFHRLKGEPIPTDHVSTPQLQSATINWHLRVNSEENVKCEVWDVVDKGFDPSAVATDASGATTFTHPIESEASASPFELGALQSQRQFASVRASAAVAASIADATATGNSGAHSVAFADASTVDVYHETHCVVLLLDITKWHTLEYVRLQLELVPIHIPTLVLGNFRDAANQRQIFKEDIHALLYGSGNAKSQPLKRRPTELLYFECSLRNCYGLQALHQYFGVPFLQLKRATIQQQLRLVETELASVKTAVVSTIHDQRYGDYVEHIQATQSDIRTGRKHVGERGGGAKETTIVVNGSVSEQKHRNEKQENASVNCASLSPKEPVDAVEQRYVPVDDDDVPKDLVDLPARTTSRADLRTTQLKLAHDDATIDATPAVKQATSTPVAVASKRSKASLNATKRSSTKTKRSSANERVVKEPVAGTVQIVAEAAADEPPMHLEDFQAPKTFKLDDFYSDDDDDDDDEEDDGGDNHSNDKDDDSAAAVDRDHDVVVAPPPAAAAAALFTKQRSHKQQVLYSDDSDDSDSDDVEAKKPVQRGGQRRNVNSAAAAAAAASSSPTDRVDDKSVDNALTIEAKAPMTLSIASLSPVASALDAATANNADASSAAGGSTIATSASSRLRSSSSNSNSNSAATSPVAVAATLSMAPASPSLDSSRRPNGAATDETTTFQKEADAPANDDSDDTDDVATTLAPQQQEPDDNDTTNDVDATTRVALHVETETKADANDVASTTAAAAYELDDAVVVVVDTLAIELDNAADASIDAAVDATTLSPVVPSVSEVTSIAPRDAVVELPLPPATTAPVNGVDEEDDPIAAICDSDADERHNDDGIDSAASAAVAAVNGDRASSSPPHGRPDILLMDDDDDENSNATVAIPALPFTPLLLQSPVSVPRAPAAVPKPSSASMLRSNHDLDGFFSESASDSDTSPLSLPSAKVTAAAAAAAVASDDDDDDDDRFARYDARAARKSHAERRRERDELKRMTAALGASSSLSSSMSSIHPHDNASSPSIGTTLGSGVSADVLAAIHAAQEEAMRMLPTPSHSLPVESASSGRTSDSTSGARSRVDNNDTKDRTMTSSRRSSSSKALSARRTGESDIEQRDDGAGKPLRKKKSSSSSNSNSNSNSKSKASSVKKSSSKAGTSSSRRRVIVLDSDDDA